MDQGLSITQHCDAVAKIKFLCCSVLHKQSSVCKTQEAMALLCLALVEYTILFWAVGTAFKMYVEKLERIQETNN